jgi:uncharacterized repeat protein (TIGR02543 family)
VAYVSRRKKLYTKVFIALLLLATCVTTYVVFFMPRYLAVSFDTLGGTEISSVEFKKGEALNEVYDDLIVPEKPGSIFLYWYVNADGEQRINRDYIVNKPTIIYAKWRAENYSFNFDLNGGTNLGSELASVNISFGSSFTLNKNDLLENTIEGYEQVVAGWDTNPQVNYGEVKYKVDQPYVLNTDYGANGENVILYAIWKPKTVFVHYQDYPGIDSLVVEIVKGTLMPANLQRSPFRMGHKFIDWFLDSNFTLLVDFDTYLFTENKILYAKFDIQTFKVTFNSMGGSEVTEPIKTINYNTPVDKPTDPVKTGYKFLGWWLGVEQGGSINYQSPYNFTHNVTADTILYAKWEEDYPYETPADVFITQAVGEDLAIIGLNDKMLSEYVVPRTINGKNVTQILNYGFKECTLATRIVLSKNITLISSGAFDSTPNLQNINVSALNPKYKDINGVLYESTILIKYPSNRAEIDLTIDNSCLSIASGAFYKALNLITLNLNNVQLINFNAFNECSSLQIVTITPQLDTFSDMAFLNCENLSNIILNNTNFATDDYALYNSDYTELIMYLPGKANSTYAVNTNTREIHSFAFAYAKNLNVITFGNSLTTIGSNAFIYCSNLQELTIPQSVTEIGGENHDYNVINNCNFDMLVVKVHSGSFAYTYFSSYPGFRNLVEI